MILALFSVIASALGALASIVGSAIAVIASYISFRLAVALAVIAALVGAFAVVHASFDSISSLAAPLWPTGQYWLLAYSAFPTDSLGILISSVVSFEAAIWVYRNAVRVFNIIGRAAS